MPRMARNFLKPAVVWVVIRLAMLRVRWAELCREPAARRRKGNFEYIVRWIHNPRERWAPYCPKEKRDLTPEDYSKNNKPYVFDTELNSRCPNDGAELQVQNMTVMPNFRLSDSDARDIATYLFSLSSPPSYPDASFMDDPSLKAQGRSADQAVWLCGLSRDQGL